ncbi:MAG TPA: hypothetical protein VGM27_07905 [Acidobacteriaceae bacterium]
MILEIGCVRVSRTSRIVLNILLTSASSILCLPSYAQVTNVNTFETSAGTYSDTAGKASYRIDSNAYTEPRDTFKLSPSIKNGNEVGWINNWFRTVDRARASQPHFTAPIVTTHVMLVQQYRYDMSWQQDAGASTVTSNYGASRGLEVIPSTRLEAGISPPNYLVHQSNVKDGIGDLAWQVKFRAFSATEHKGDYFVGFFLGGTFPAGTRPNGTGHATMSPTFAAAKGIGPWDIQSTIGGILPLSGTSTLGRTVVFNTAINYRIRGEVWPMLEQNSTFWSGGAMGGKKQVFLTPGLVLGSVPLDRRLRIAVGGGFQTAVTSYHQYNHRWILSVRFPF